MLLKEIKNVGDSEAGYYVVSGRPGEWEYVDGPFSTKDEAETANRKHSTHGADYAVKYLRKQPLKEDALESKNAEDLWADNKESAASYVSTMSYMVRPIPKTSPIKYEAFSVVGTTRKPYGTFSAADLQKTLTPIRPNQTPDAEGFTTYTDPTELMAFKYSGDPVRLKLDDENTVTMNDGDYLVRTVKGSQFEYAVENDGDFETDYKKA